MEVGLPLRAKWGVEYQDHDLLAALGFSVRYRVSRGKVREAHAPLG